MYGKMEIRSGPESIQDFALPSDCLRDFSSQFYDSSNDQAGEYIGQVEVSTVYYQGIWYKVSTNNEIQPLTSTDVTPPNLAKKLIGPLVVVSTLSGDCQASKLAPLAIGHFYGATKVIAAETFAIGDELTVNASGHLCLATDVHDFVVARVQEGFDNNGGIAGNSVSPIGFTTYGCGYMKSSA